MLIDVVVGQMSVIVPRDPAMDSLVSLCRVCFGSVCGRYSSYHQAINALICRFLGDYQI